MQCWIVTIGSIVFLFCNCVSTPIRAPKINPADISPIRVIIISDGVIYSKPKPRIIDGSSAQGVIHQLGNACEKRLLKEMKVEVVGRIESVGMGLNQTQTYAVQKDELSGIDKLSPPYYKSGKIDSMGNAISELIGDLSRTASNQLYKLSYSTFLVDYVTNESAREKLARLKNVSGADYCFLTSMYGDIRRTPIPIAAKVATAVLTGVVSMLSPAGGFILIPGDETDLETISFMINLTTGEVKWTKRFRKYELYAVEEFRAMDWAYSVFRKFPRGRF